MRFLLLALCLALAACSAEAAQGRPEKGALPEPDHPCPSAWRWSGPASNGQHGGEFGQAVRPPSAGTGHYQTRRAGFEEHCDPPVCKGDVCTRGCRTGEGHGELGFTSEDGHVEWRREVPLLSFQTLLLLADDERAYLLKFAPSAAGATFMAFDGRSGRALYETSVGGMTCLHSTYSNRIRFELSSGRIRVWGWESAGRYVTAIDPETGAVLCERLFDEVVCR